MDSCSIIIKACLQINLPKILIVTQVPTALMFPAPLVYSSELCTVSKNIQQMTQQNVHYCYP